jgi:hypothetical protein
MAYRFYEMGDDEILAWWIFYRQDNEGPGDSTPKTINKHIKEFRSHTINGIINILKEEYS